METGPRDEIDLRLERAVLVSVLLPEEELELDADDPLGEIRALAETAGVRVVGSMLQKREHPDGRTYLGKGKVGELTAMVKELGAKVVRLIEALEEHDDIQKVWTNAVLPEEAVS